MQSSFLGPSKTAGENMKKSGNVEKLSLEKLEKSRNFVCERSSESPEINLKRSYGVQPNLLFVKAGGEKSTKHKSCSYNNFSIVIFHEEIRKESFAL